MGSPPEIQAKPTGERTRPYESFGNFRKAFADPLGCDLAHAARDSLQITVVTRSANGLTPYEVEA
jgi:hypothetical protein